MTNVWVIPFAAVGLAISLYIYITQSKKKAMVCIRGEDCDAVVSSKYNKTFGIKNEYGGIAYYSAVIIAAVLSLVGINTVFSIDLNLLVLIAASGAALFSIYLTAIQAFVLRIWCEYCVTSAVMSIAIFVIEFLPYLR